MQPQVLEVEDFSGGITDNYVAGPINKAQSMDNLLINQYKAANGQVGKPFIRDGSEIWESADPRLPSGNQRVTKIYNYKGWGGVLFNSERDFFYFDTVFNTLLGPTGNKVFPLGTSTSDQITITYWNNHLIAASEAYAPPMKIYFDGSNDLQARNAGLPALASDPVITPGANTGKNFLYKFLYYYTYTVGTVVFEDFGSTAEVAVANADAPNTNANAISSIPVLANGGTYNYDTTVIKVKIYRTENNGTEFYYVGQVTNGTTTYNDNMSDATLVDQEPIYTSGGVVENDSPPLCKYVHVTEDNVCIYANAKVGSEKFTNRLYYSIPADIDSVPGDFYEEVDEEITGVSSLNSRVIVFCKSSVWRLDGFFDFLGRGAVTKVKIGDVTGCISSNSIIKTVEGIFFAGEGGFYYTDGNSVLKISEDIIEAYKGFTNTEAKKKRINGAYDPVNKRIWWGVQVDSSSQDCDTCYILDLNWGISDSMPFTTASGTSDNFRPSALAFVDNEMLRGDSRGYIFRHNEDLRTDPKVDTGAAASTWSDATIIYNYRSCALNFGTNYVRKYVPRITATLKNESNVSLQINSVNDDGRKTSALKPIRYRGNIVWGDPDIIWGTTSLIWNFNGLIIEQRRFPHTSLRCNYKQLQFTNALVPIVNSDLYGVGNINATAKTFTLTAAGNYKWPSDPVDYYLAFEGDDYTREFAVTARTSDTVLTFSDLLNFSTNATGTKWVLRGYPKGEYFNLLSYTMGYALFGQTQAVFNAGESGEVA